MTNQEAIRLMRNLPTMCEFTDAYGEPIDSDAYYEAVDMAISALQAQDLQPTCNQLATDCISRKAAIDAAIKADMENNSNVLSEKRARVIDRHISAVPSAQPEIEERTEEFAQNVPKEDLISRKAAIDALKNERSDWNCDYNVPVDHCIDAIYSVPSAQPDTKAQLPGEGTTFDLISRLEAIDVLMEFDKKLRKINWYQYPYTEHECRGVDEAIVKIANLPSAQPEPCDDAVSRNAVYDAIVEKGQRSRRYKFGEIWELNGEEIREALDTLPSVQPEPQWIPCSEMEPKKSGHYLCTHSGTGIVSPDYYTTQEQAEELFADPEDEYLDMEEYIGWTSKNVIAWMPLPEPYRAERRTDDL